MKRHTDPHWFYLGPEDELRPGDLCCHTEVKYHLFPPIQDGRKLTGWIHIHSNDRGRKAQEYGTGLVFARRNPHSWELIDTTLHASEPIADDWEYLSWEKRKDAVGDHGSWKPIEVFPLGVRGVTYKGLTLEDSPGISVYACQGRVRRPKPSVCVCDGLNQNACPYCPRIGA